MPNEDESHVQESDSDMSQDDTLEQICLMADEVEGFQHKSAEEEEFQFHDETVRESETTENHEHDDHLANEFVFPGCPLNVTTSSVFLLLFILKHKLTNEAAEDLLQLLIAHFPPGHMAETSLYRLKKHFKNRFQPFEKTNRLVCSVCEDLLPENEISCPRLECKKAELPANEFVIFNVESALAELVHGTIGIDNSSFNLYIFTFFLCYRSPILF